jgi:predicted nucleic-acid-binding protein
MGSRRNEVLQSRGLDRQQIVQALDLILRSQQLVVDQAEQVVRGLRAYGVSTADFADCLIERTAAAVGCARTMTFDLAAAKTAGMTSIQ